jgi:photosystem II stability/assembly factor-like uncharacterized protein
MHELDFRGLDAASQVAFKPHFGEVVRRAARRRRRTRAAGALVAVAALATGTGVATGALAGGPGTAAPLMDTSSTPAFIPPAGSSNGPGPAVGRRSQTGAMVAGDLDHLYLRYTDCQRPGVDCAVMLAASEDGGATWTEWALPVAHNSLVMLTALGPRTLLASVQDGTAVRQYWQASTDGGHTWREVSDHVVEAIPAGWLPVDSSVSLNRVGVFAADPATGDLVRLAQPRPLALARLAAGLPPAAGLWASGFTGTATTPVSTPQGTEQSVTGTGSSVEVSHDGGVNWLHWSFPDNLDDGDTFGGAAVATFDGRTGYAVGYAGGALLVYCTVDGGATWSKTPAREKVSGRPEVYAAVRADGTLFVQVGTQATDHPAMYRSTDGGQTLRPVPVGPGAAAVAVAGGYAQTGWPNSSGAWLSPDGATWSYAAPPDLP